jgi:AcrR family transcriptional regulator
MARKTMIDRKKQIIEITRDLIFNEGFSNFTVRTVAGRVGISEAAIYKHYASKEELLMALLDSLFIPWQKAFKTIAESNSTLTEKLRSLAKIHIDFLFEKKLNPLLFFSEAISPANKNLLSVLQKNLHFFGEIVAGLLKKGVENKELVSGLDIDSATACFLGIVQSSVIKWTVFRIEDDIQASNTRNVDFLLKRISR